MSTRCAPTRAASAPGDIRRGVRASGPATRAAPPRGFTPPRGDRARPLVDEGEALEGFAEHDRGHRAAERLRRRLEARDLAHDPAVAIGRLASRPCRDLNHWRSRSASETRHVGTPSFAATSAEMSSNSASGRVSSNPVSSSARWRASSLAGRAGRSMRGVSGFTPLESSPATAAPPCESPSRGSICTHEPHAQPSPARGFRA